MHQYIRQIMPFPVQPVFNPGTYSFNATRIWYDIGVNRLSEDVHVKQQFIQSAFSDISQWTQDKLFIGYRDTNINDSFQNSGLFGFV